MVEDIIDSIIVEDIKKKVKTFRSLGNKRKKQELARRCIEQFEADSICNSYQIEHPELAGYDFSNHAVNLRIARGKKDLLSAFNWGKNHFVPGKISEEYIRNIAGMTDIEFHNGKPAEYRSTFSKHYFGSVRPGLATCTPPYAQEVPDEMSRFIAELNEKLKVNEFDGGIRSALQNAFFTHLHLARIHPFEDTNGRTSRVIQDIILSSKDLPAPALFHAERGAYYKFLDNAVYDFKIRTGDNIREYSEGEINFFNYMAGKVSASLDIISKCIIST